MPVDSRGKKHVCPKCGAMFYDMGRQPVECPRCRKRLFPDDELEFIKKKKKAEVKIKDDRESPDIEIEDDNVDASESEMFFDMESEEAAIKGPADDEEY